MTPFHTSITLGAVSQQSGVGEAISRTAWFPWSRKRCRSPFAPYT